MTVFHQLFPCWQLFLFFIAFFTVWFLSFLFSSKSYSIICQHCGVGFDFLKIFSPFFFTFSKPFFSFLWSQTANWVPAVVWHADPVFTFSSFSLAHTICVCVVLKLLQLICHLDIGTYHFLCWLVHHSITVSRQANSQSVGASSGRFVQTCLAQHCAKLFASLDLIILQGSCWHELAAWSQCQSFGVFSLETKRRQPVK